MSIAELASNHIEAAPEPNPEAIEALTQTLDEGDSGASDTDTNTAAPAVPAFPDTQAGFNPAIHEANPDGTPRLTKEGKYRLKRGRKTGQPSVSASSNTSISASVPSIANTASMQATATMAVISITSVLQSFYGEDWKPQEHETQAMISALTNYMVVKGVAEPPPEVGLVLAAGAYAIPRVGTILKRKKDLKNAAAANQGPKDSGATG